MLYAPLQPRYRVSSTSILGLVGSYDEGRLVRRHKRLGFLAKKPGDKFVEYDIHEGMFTS